MGECGSWAPLGTIDVSTRAQGAHAETRLAHGTLAGHPRAVGTLWAPFFREGAQNENALQAIILLHFYLLSLSLKIRIFV